MSAREQIPDDGQLLRVDVDVLFPSPTNPRKSFPEDEMYELAESIASVGVMQPILVRPIPLAMKEAHNTDAQLEIVAGERRWRASAIAGMVDVPILLRDLTDGQVIRLQIIENLQRAGLSSIEEAEGYGVLQAQGLSPAQIAQEVGKSKAYIYAKLKLLALCEEGRAKVRAGELSESIALLIARIPVRDMQIQAIADVLEEDYGEPMSVREAAEHIQENFTKRLGKAPFPTTATDLIFEAGACDGCPKRMGNMEDTEPKHADVCTDPACYRAKADAHQANLRAEAEAKGQQVIHGEAAQKIKPKSWTEVGGGFVDLDAGCHEAPYDYERRHQPTYRELLGDKLPTISLLENPHALDDEDLPAVIEIAPRAEVFELLKETAGIDIAKKHETAEADRAKEKAQEKEENEFRSRLFAEVRSQTPLILTTPDLQLIAGRMWNLLGHDDEMRLAKIWHPELSCDAGIKNIGASINDMDDASLTRLMLDIALISDTHKPAWSDREPTHLLAAAERIGIDPKAFRKALKDGNSPQRTKAKADDKAVQKSSSARSEVMYRHPDDPRIAWSGRGKKPKWVEDWLASGHTFDELKADRTEKKAKGGAKK
ncbi:MAG: ParB/RepB/Spo0J family partition protein [Zoogloea sp.]|nr:ParB/RepB/Spo0J family partition protein [Zoogloea sp.]